MFEYSNQQRLVGLFIPPWRRWITFDDGYVEFVFGGWDVVIDVVEPVSQYFNSEIVEYFDADLFRLVPRRSDILR